MKRVWVYVLLVSCITILAAVFFTLRNTRPYQNNDAIRGIPLNTAIIVRLSGIEGVKKVLLEKTDYKNELQRFALTSSLIELAKQLDSLQLFRQSDFLTFTDRSLIVSFHTEGKDQVHALLATVANTKAEEKVFINWIQDLSEHGCSISKRDYDAAVIYSITHIGTGKVFFVSVNQGLIIGSQSHILIESALRQMQLEESLLSDAVFNKIYKTSSPRSSANVYINFKTLPRLLASVFNDENEIPSMFVEKGTQWAELDIDPKAKEISMNGFMTGDADDLLKELFTGMQPQKSQISEVLPSNTRLYISYSVESPEEMQKRFHSYLKKSQKESSYWSHINEVKRKTGFDWDASLFSFIEDEMAVVYTDRNPMKPEENVFFIAKTKGKTFAEGKLNQALLALTKSNKAEPNHVYYLDKDTSFPIYKGLPDNLLQHVFGWFFKQVPDKYFTFYNNYIIFSNDIRSLQEFLYANVLNKTLANQKHFETFREKFSVRENLFIYSELATLPGFLKGTLKEDIVNFSAEQNQALSNFFAGGIQLSATGNMLYASAYISYLPSRENEPHTIWQSLMDSMVVAKPALVLNHNSLERELLVQDAANNIYLINNSGRMLWKKALDGRILSDIVQVDFYRNNKLQYLFNTENRIYLIDRNGNSVDKYPILLSSKASNGISVVDYDNNRDYRLFLATQDQRIRLFDKQGNSITGWEFRKSEGIVNQPVQHFRSNSKDYIVFADAHRMYILDRRGNVRVNPDKHIQVNAGSKFYLRGADTQNSQLVTSSATGDLVSVNIPSGNTTMKSLWDEKKEHGFLYYEVNNNPRFVFVSADELQVFTQDGKQLMKRGFEQAMSTVVDVYQFSGNNFKLGLKEKDGGHIFLVNEDGSDYRGFPLKGYSRYSIGFLKSSSSQFNLVVAGDNNYLYNYRVE